MTRRLLVACSRSVQGRASALKRPASSQPRRQRFVTLSIFAGERRERCELRRASDYSKHDDAVGIERQLAERRRIRRRSAHSPYRGQLVPEQRFAPVSFQYGKPPGTLGGAQRCSFCAVPLMQQPL